MPTPRVANISQIPRLRDTIRLTDRTALLIDRNVPYCFIFLKGCQSKYLLETNCEYFGKDGKKFKEIFKQFCWSVPFKINKA